MTQKCLRPVAPVNESTLGSEPYLGTTGSAGVRRRHPSFVDARNESSADRAFALVAP